MQTTIKREFIYLPIFKADGTEAWFVPELFVVQESVGHLLINTQDKTARLILMEHLERCKPHLESGIINHLEDFNDLIKPLYEAINHAKLPLPPPVNHDRAQAWYPHLNPPEQKFLIILDNFCPGLFERLGAHFDYLAGLSAFILTIWLAVNSVNLIATSFMLLSTFYAARILFSWVDSMSPIKGRFQLYGNGLDRWLSGLYHYPHKTTLPYLLSHAGTMLVLALNTFPFVFSNLAGFKKLVGMASLKPFQDTVVNWFVFLSATVGLTKYYQDVHSFFIKSIPYLREKAYVLAPRYENTVLTKPLEHEHLTALVRPYLPFMHIEEKDEQRVTSVPARRSQSIRVAAPQ